MQYATLLKDGIGFCQQLGGDVWTDFNEHDPGVTILEQLCYAITDAGMRGDYAVADLLARPASTPHDRGIDAGRKTRHTLLTGDRILSTEAVTVSDYRKLLYDGVVNLKNAWLMRADSEIDGLYKIYVETHGEELNGKLTRDDALAKLAQDVRVVMSAHRNLGEDVDSVTVLTPFDVTVSAVIEIARDASPSDILADVMFKLQCDLIPFPEVATVQELLAQGMTFDQIFSGPRLDIGVIADAELSPWKSAITVEDAAKLITSVPGVQGVRALRINGHDTGSIAFEPLTVPRLAPSIFTPLKTGAVYPISLERDNAPYPVDTERVFRALEQKLAGIHNREILSEQKMASEPYCALPVGDYRNPAQYYSIQHQFPLTYGVGKYGVPMLGKQAGMARVQRAMQARQLKTYLLFFEQVLRDHFSQIGNLWQLFALDPALESTYFQEPLLAEQPDDDEPPNLRDFDLLASTAPVVPARYVAYLHAGRRHPEILLRSVESDGLLQARQVRARLLDRGRHEHHYRLLPLPKGQVHLLLADEDGKTIAFGGRRFPTMRAARREARRLAALLRVIAHWPQLQNDLVRIEAKGKASVHFVSQSGQSLLAATQLTPERQTWCVAKLLEFGVHEKNFLLRPAGAGRVRLFLCAADGAVIVQGEQLYRSGRHARSAARALATIIATLCCDPAARARHLRLLPKAGDAAGDDMRAYRRNLSAIAGRLEDFSDRRNRFLDHLLARFGERFDNAALATFDPRLHGEKAAFYRDLIRWKIAFLRHCCSLGAERNKAYDYRRHGVRNLAGSSGLERRLCCLLGIFGGGKKTADHMMEGAPPYRYWHESAKGQEDIRPAAEADGDGDRYTFFSDNPDIFHALLKHGSARKNYAMDEKRGHFDLYFSFPGEQPLHIERTGSRAAAEQAISGLTAYFGRYLEQESRIYAGEELILVEHVLLRHNHCNGAPAPEEPSDDEGAAWEVMIDAGDLHEVLSVQTQGTAHYRLDIEIGVDGLHLAVLFDAAGTVLARSAQGHATRDDAVVSLHRLRQTVKRQARHRHGRETAASVDAEFHSSRISLIFPDWPIRFQNPEFRNFAMRIAGENCPAHLAAECHWLEAPQMTAFGKLHRDWLEKKYAVERDDGIRVPCEAIDDLNDAAALLRRFIKKLAD